MIRYTVRQRLSVEYHHIIDTELDMPAQRAVFVEHVVGETGGDGIHFAQHLGDRTGRYRDRAVLEQREEPVPRYYRRR